MSNALAIATVTAALGQIVEKAARSAVNGASLAMTRPDEGTDTPSPRVHLYLYQVLPNAVLRNSDLPVGSGTGQAVRRPSVAVDLDYLLTFYGNPTEHEAERMMGAVLRDLHAHPLLTRDDILSAIGSGILATSNLADAAERVKFMQLPLTLDDLSTLWSVFFQTKHAVSVAYRASVVIIEADAPYLPPDPA